MSQGDPRGPDQSDSILALSSKPVPGNTKQSSGSEPKAATRKEKEPPKSPSENLPPAPLSDSQLSGQIKYVARPIEYLVMQAKSDRAAAYPIPQDEEEGGSGKGKEREIEQDPEQDQVLKQGLGAEEEEEGPQSRSPDLEPSHPDRKQSSGPDKADSTISESKPTPTPKIKPRKRIAENELIVLTDRGVQIWDLSVWGNGRRIQCDLEGDDVLQ